jgi:hypothetical protein
MSESEWDVLQAVHTSSEIPTSGSYDDTGALAIHKGYYKPNSVASYPRLVGVEEVPELSEVQQVCHPAFGENCPLSLRGDTPADAFTQHRSSFQRVYHALQSLYLSLRLILTANMPDGRPDQHPSLVTVEM